jgi:hemolysin activation/secretion protein
MRTRAGGRAARRSKAALSACSGTALGLAWLLLSGFAQPPSNPTSPPTRDELRGTVAPPAREEQRARLTVEGGLERGPCALDRPEYGAIRFTLTAADFENLRGLTPDELRPAWASYVGTEQPLSVICEIRDRAAALLREAGYIAAIEVPEQRIEGGRVHFRVLMAKLVALRVRGEAGRNERLIEAYLNHLTDQEVFNRYQAERYLLLAGDLPGTSVRLALRPAGTVPGEVVGEITVVRLPGLLDVNVQNYGSRAVGRGGDLLRGQVYGLTGLGDRTTLAFYTTADFREQQTLQLAHDFRIGGEGLQLGGQLTYSWARPDIGNAALDFRSRTLFATLEANYPLIRTQQLSLRAGGGLDVIDQMVEFNTLPLSEERLRVLFGRLALDAASPRRWGGPTGDPLWRMQGLLEVRQGLNGLGASEGCDATFTNCLAFGVVPPSRLEGDPAATLLRWQASGEVRPIPNVTFYLGASGQYAWHPLFTFEQFTAGNYTVGRGYDPATLTGDRGAGIQAELRFGRLAPQSPIDLALQPYLFFDAAWVRNEDRLFITAGRKNLQSVGGGLRAVLGNRAQLDLTLAVPLSRAGLLTERPDPRLLISYTTRLWPWRMR